MTSPQPATRQTVRTDEPLYAVETRARTLPTWRSVFAGAVIGVATMFALGALWFAIAYGSGVDTVRDNLDWYLGGTAIFSLFVAGFAAGNLSGLRGPGAGMVHGTTVWALATVTALTLGIPSVMSILGFTQAQVADVGRALGSSFPPQAAWTAFYSLVVGWAAAALGGFLGGATTRDDGLGLRVIGPGRLEALPKARRDR